MEKLDFFASSLFFLQKEKIKKLRQPESRGAIAIKAKEVKAFGTAATEAPAIIKYQSKENYAT